LKKLLNSNFFDNKKYERIKNLALNVNALLIFAELFLSSLPKNIYFFVLLNKKSIAEIFPE